MKRLALKLFISQILNYKLKGKKKDVGGFIFDKLKYEKILATTTFRLKI